MSVKATRSDIVKELDKIISKKRELTKVAIKNIKETKDSDMVWAFKRGIFRLKLEVIKLENIKLLISLLNIKK
jgi:hypothetical protein